MHTQVRHTSSTHFALYAEPACSATPDILLLPSEGIIVGLACPLSPQALTEPLLTKHLPAPGSLMPHTAWFWEAQKQDSFTSEQKDFDWNGPRDYSHKQSRRPSPSQLSQRGLPPALQRTRTMPEIGSCLNSANM